MKNPSHLNWRRVPRRSSLSRVVLLCIVLVLMIVMILVPFAKGQMHECKGVELDLVEEHALSLDSCLKIYNASSIKDIGPSQFACVGKCVLEKAGLVDDEGHPHKENIFKFITDALPKEVHDDLQVKFEACLTDETEELDPKEESCVSYLPLMMCLHLAFLEECT